MMSIKHLCLLVTGAIGCSDASSSWLDTGELDAHGSVLVIDSAGWMAGATRTTPATSRVPPKVEGWPVAACMDVDADRRCDFENEPFAACGQESNRLRCTPRPWKLTLTRTQVFDGVIGEHDIALAPRLDETSVHAVFVAHERDGSHARDVSLCWRKRGLCSTQSEGESSLQPLKLCGVDDDTTAELEIAVGEEHRTQVEVPPRAMDVAVSRAGSPSDGVALRIVASESIDQALVQIRSPSEKVLWTSTAQMIVRLPAESFDLTIPGPALATAETGSQLLIQIVAVDQEARDPRLLTQAITETRIWVPLP
jgi:hypothetical protein